ncbi:MAG: NAD-dependent epimerase/dehydratase family protein [Coprobacillaceae bacterium]
MKKILITGGTVFVSRFVTTYYVEKGYDVYVLNRNHREQVEGVTLIEADRKCLGDSLKRHTFDIVIDVTSYNKKDVENLLYGLHTFNEYIFISSSAVYPETLPQPFVEEQELGYNSIWQDYGVNKIEAENYLLSKVPDAYIIRPPYLYGPMQNIYREPFVFECALKKRKFYIPKDGTMKLQFFYIEDLCRVIDKILDIHPENHIFNVGNKEIVDINTFIELCYQVVGTPLEKVYADSKYQQRDYFSFHDYEYILNVDKQDTLLSNTTPLYEGLKKSYEWYCKHKDEVIKKTYITFINQNIVKA